YHPINETLLAKPLSLTDRIAAPPMRVTMQDPLPFVLIKILPRSIQAHTGTGRVALHVILTLFIAGCLPGADAAFSQRLALIRDDQVVVNAHDPPKAAALFTCSERGVEGKGAG